MFEIHVTIACPDLVAAAQLLAGCAAHKAEITPAPVASTAPAPATAPVTVQAAPAPVAPNVPLATAPTFSIQQIAKAGADLFTNRPELRPQVNALLSQFGLQSVTDLKPDQYGAFATALRGLGANI